MKTGTKIGLVGLAIGIPAIGYWAYTRTGRKKKENGEDWDDDEPEWDIDDITEEAEEKGYIDDSVGDYVEQQHTRDDVSYGDLPGSRYTQYFSLRTSRVLSCRR